MEILKSGAQKLGIQLTTEQLEKFEIYYRELTDWNRRVNLTSVTGYEEVQVKHFLDSLTLKLAIGPEDNDIIDVGTGAGLPGIPLKIALPDTRLVLLEATAKKVNFLLHVVAELGLNDVEVVAGRAEEIARDTRYREKFIMALSRAVAPLPTLVELTLPFCAVGGRFIAQKKGDIDAELDRAQKAVSVLGGHLREIKAIDLEELGERRLLVVIDKVRATPRIYPRRPGIPAKRPILA